MNGSFLRFYVLEKQHIHHRPVWEWLLERANTMGIRGGSAFRAIAGFGRHHTMHEAHLLELIGWLYQRAKAGVSGFAETLTGTDVNITLLPMAYQMAVKNWKIVTAVVGI